MDATCKMALWQYSRKIGESNLSNPIFRTSKDAECHCRDCLDIDILHSLRVRYEAGEVYTNMICCLCKALRVVVCQGITIELLTPLCALCRCIGIASQCRLAIERPSISLLSLLKGIRAV